MAFLQVDFVSQSLLRKVSMNVILPADKIVPGKPAGGNQPYKTLYLLHGVLGDYTDWVTGTSIQRWAQEKDLAVVMPSGDNRFYVDNPGVGNCYGEFIGKELVELTRKMFPPVRQAGGYLYRGAVDGRIRRDSQRTEIS